MSIGAKNRLLAFQRYFTKVGSQEACSQMATEHLMPAMLETEYSTRLIRFLMLASSEAQEVKETKSISPIPEADLEETQDMRKEERDDSAVRS